MEHFPKRKKLLIGLRLVYQAINIVFIGLIPFFPMENQARLVIFGASVLLLNVLSAVTAPGLTVWHIQFIPQRIRVKYFS